MGIEFDSDFLLVQKMRMGDEAALEEFVIKYYPRIHKYCQLHIDDYDYAEDITQETFARFFRTLNQYRHYGKAVNYLYVIAGNVCNDYHRRKKEILMEKLPDISNRQADNMDMQVEVRIALESLPDELREVSVLYFIQE